MRYPKFRERIIIDLRGNRGGNAIYSNLIALFATRTRKGTQGLVLSSKDILKYFENYAKNYSEEIFQPVVDRIKTGFGKIVDGPKYPAKGI